MNKKKLKILLVDDDELSRRMMGMLLTGEGYDYETASNGVEAVEAAQTKGFDFVLMDLQMPLMDGYQATAEIRAWEADTGIGHIPIVALTAMLFDQETQQCLDAGMDACVMKPFNATELFQLIEAHASKTADAPVLKGEVKTELGIKAKFLDIQAALPRFGGDIDVYQEFLSEFLDMLPERKAQLQELFQVEDYKSLTDSAHNLKGVSASLGAMQLSALALELERQAHTGDLEPIETTIKEINDMFVTLQNTAMEKVLKFTS